MKLSDFDYELPQERIAQSPAEPRDSSRLMHFDGKNIEHKIFHEIVDILQSGDVLVINDTRVIPARLETTEGREVFLTRPENLDNHPEEHEIWRCLVRGGKHFQVGAKFEIAADFTGEVLKILGGGERLIRFEATDFEEALEKYGATPLPPYIEQNEKKVPRYQTVFANHPGSVAAPTAGLHFTDEVFEKLHAKGITVEKVTLHVGLGTFLPVKTEKIEDHPMHSEYFELTPPVAERLNRAKKEGCRIIAVGSTSCRVLESATDDCGRLLSKTGETGIFIYPGYRWKFISGMLTNFHLPKSTLIMLVAALIGREKTMELYETAIQQQYRFYSFGDAMLLLPSMEKFCPACKQKA